MRKLTHIKWVVLLIALFSCVRFAGAQGSAQDPPNPPASAPMSVELDSVKSASIEADRWEAKRDAEGKGILLVGTGNVHAMLDFIATAAQPASHLEITADTLTVNSGTRTLIAEGQVRTVSEEGTAEGERLEYRWVERAGVVEDFTTERSGLVFRGGRLEYADRRLVILEGSFTTCCCEDPDYRVLARRIEYEPGRGITARNVGLEVFGRGLFSIPRLEYRMGQGAAQEQIRLPYPRPGRTRVSGFTLTQPVPLGRNLDGEVEMTTRRGFRGAIQYDQQRARLPVYALADWKQEEPARDRRPVLVSRVPQVGLRFGRTQEWDLSAANIREHDTKTDAGRIQLAWRKTIVQRGLGSGWGARVSGRLAAYTTGDSFATGGFETTYGRDNGDLFTVVGLRQNFVEGNTPFLWDQVQIRTEVFGGKRIAVGNYRVGAVLRYDLDRKEVYDTQITLARRFTCLEPELRYSSRRKGLYVGLRVLGRDPRPDDRSYGDSWD